MILPLRQGASRASGAPCLLRKAIADEDDHLEVRVGLLPCKAGAGRRLSKQAESFLLARAMFVKIGRYDLRWFMPDLKLRLRRIGKSAMPK